MLPQAPNLKPGPVPLNMSRVDLLLEAVGNKYKWQPMEPNGLPEVFVDSRTRLAWTHTDESGTTTVEIGGINGQPTWLKVGISAPTAGLTHFTSGRRQIP